VGLTVGEKPVDDYSNNREEEDANGPQDLVEDWTVGLEDLD
jgi:hypothetical protein